MKRYILSLAILVVGLFWVGVGAPVWGGQSLLQPSQPGPAAPDPYDAVLFPYSPERDAKVTEILGETEAINAMLAGRELGRDYWMRVSYGYGEYLDARESGENATAMVDIYFDPPVSYSGVVPARSDPCAGRDPADDDPCLTAHREYLGETGYATFSDVQWITAATDLRRGAVVEISYWGPVSKWSLDAIKGRYAQ